jgi:ribosomal protein L40E
VKTIIAKHVDACIAEIRGEVEREIHAAISALVPLTTQAKPRAKPKRAKRSPSRRNANAASIPATPAPRVTKAKDRATVKPSATATSSRRTCGCGPVGRHRRECAQAGAKPARKASSDDEERGAGVPADRPRRELGADVPDVRGLDAAYDPEAPPPAPRRRGRPRKDAITVAPELPVIPHLTLVAMLAADRANNAVGDAGGFVARPDAAPSLVGHTDEKREHCPVHGWVGRIAFERDGHEHCEVERSADSSVCARCNGTGWVTAKACKRCDGTGYIEPEAENVPLDEREKVQASVPLDVTVDGLRRRLGRDHRGHDRAETTAAKAFTRAEIAAGWDELRALDLAEPGFVEPPRPKTRADCVGAEKPCPYVSCRHHLALEVTEAGSIKLVFPDIEPWELTHSCSLDAADLGPHTLDALGEKLNVTRERVRQLEVKSLYAMRAAAMSERVVPRSEIENAPPRAAEGA